MKARMKRLYETLIGMWLDDLVHDIGCRVAPVCKRIDDLLNQARMDGETHWFLEENHKKVKESGPASGV